MIFLRAFSRFLSTSPAAKPYPLKVKPAGLEQFFENGEAFPKFDPEKRIVYGRAWKTDELRLKSFEDLHSLWYVLLKERNLLATQELEARRLNQTWYGYQRDYKCRLSMARLKTILTERMRMHQLALKAQERLSRAEPMEEGELWVEWDEMEKSQVTWGRPWFRKRQRVLRRIHPMF